jgi:hypothetical protein
MVAHVSPTLTHYKKMKVTLVKSNLEARITGSPAVVSFSVTQRQLNAFNKNPHAQPCDDATKWLHGVYADTFGTESGTLTMAHLRNALSR